MVEVKKSEKLSANLKLTLSLQDRLSCSRSSSLAFALKQSHAPPVIQLPCLTLLCSPCVFQAPRAASPSFLPRCHPSLLAVRSEAANESAQADSPRVHVSGG